MAETRAQDGLMHMYVSTACQHELHQDRCRLTCKFCGNPCLCPCHREADDES